jgi:very-short-patch-repair endonuclease
MAAVVKGTEALTSGALTRGQLRWNYRAIYRDVYLPKQKTRTLADDILAAWLWSGRRGVIAGRAAAALHGTKWIDEFTCVELIGRLNHAPPGIIIRRETLTADDATLRAGIPVTTPARTAFDLARHLPRDVAVAHLDALARATGVTAVEVLPLIDRYAGARGVRHCRQALSLMDSGAESPKESWLRLILCDAELPHPTTQIRVSEGRFTAYLDMGWKEPMVAVEYDGDQHRTDRRQYVMDIRRAQMLERLGWQVIRVVNEDRPSYVVGRVRDALARRAAKLPSRS